MEKIGKIIGIMLVFLLVTTTYGSIAKASIGIGYNMSHLYENPILKKLKLLKELLAIPYYLRSPETQAQIDSLISWLTQYINDHYDEYAGQLDNLTVEQVVDFLINQIEQPPSDGGNTIGPDDQSEIDRAMGLWLEQQRNAYGEVYGQVGDEQVHTEQDANQEITIEQVVPVSGR
jgi:hypothetical protein